MGRDKQIKSLASRETAKVWEVERGRMGHPPKASLWPVERTGGMGVAGDYQFVLPKEKPSPTEVVGTPKDIVKIKLWLGDETTRSFFPLQLPKNTG